MSHCQKNLKMCHCIEKKCVNQDQFMNLSLNLKTSSEKTWSAIQRRINFEKTYVLLYENMF